MNEKDIKEIRANLYIEDSAYDFYWNVWKDRILNSLNKHETLLKDKNVAYCFESDLQSEKEYLGECGKRLKILFNENGLIIYKSIRSKKNDKRNQQLSKKQSKS